MLTLPKDSPGVVFLYQHVRRSRGSNYIDIPGIISPRRFNEIYMVDGQGIVTSNILHRGNYRLTGNGVYESRG